MRNPFSHAAFRSQDLNLFFWKRSYHRTGAESYYVSTTTCKGLETFFLQFLDKVKFSRGFFFRDQSSKVGLTGPRQS